MKSRLLHSKSSLDCSNFESLWSRSVWVYNAVRGQFPWESACIVSRYAAGRTLSCSRHYQKQAIPHWSRSLMQDMFVETDIFFQGTGGASKMSADMSVPFLGKIPLDPSLSRWCPLKSPLCGCLTLLQWPHHSSVFRSNYMLRFQGFMRHSSWVSFQWVCKTISIFARSVFEKSRCSTVHIEGFIKVYGSDQCRHWFCWLDFKQFSK